MSLFGLGSKYVVATSCSSLLSIRLLILRLIRRQLGCMRAVPLFFSVRSFVLFSGSLLFRRKIWLW